MARKKKKASSFNAAKTLQRKLALQQGYYDGRFRGIIKKPLPIGKSAIPEMG